MPKKVAIIISPNWRDYAEKYLAECLESLRRQDFPGEFKIFLVDNESSEESMALLKKIVETHGMRLDESGKNNPPYLQNPPTPLFERGQGGQIEIIRNKNNDGFAKGNNDAMKLALAQDFDYIVLFNMDTVIEENCVSELVKVAERDEKIGAVQARLMLYPEKEKINSLGNLTHFLGFGYCLGYRQQMSDVGFRMSDFGCRISDVGFRMSDVGFRMSDFGKELPLILVVGGGTGAMEINKLVWESLDELTKFCQVVHVAGKGKEVSELSSEASELSSCYKSFEFLEHEKVMGIMQAADLVVSRAGLGFLTEISYLAKPAIVIPIPDSHQEDNARIFSKNEAAMVLDQKKLTSRDFANKIRELLKDETLRHKLSSNVAGVMKKGASEAIAGIIKRVIYNE